MPRLVANSATLGCNQGTAPGTLTVLPTQMADAAGMPAATVVDFVPLQQISPFGLCKSPANPQVAAATSAAGGTLTPMPCLPVVAAPWSPGAAGVTLAGQKALTVDSTCSCAWRGTIEVKDPACDVDIE